MVEKGPYRHLELLPIAHNELPRTSRRSIGSQRFFTTATKIIGVAATIAAGIGYPDIANAMYSAKALVESKTF